MIPNPLASDLDHILRWTGVWEELRGRRIFITGGTGFFGRWLLESFAWANESLSLDASACVLTRDPASFRSQAPHLAGNPALTLLPGDFTSFDFPSGNFHVILHAATVAGEASPLDLFEANLQGTRRVLEFARHCGAQRFLFTSSGAAYGRQPGNMPAIPEDYAGAPATTDGGSAYGESKRACEFLCTMYARQYGFAAPIARCFAFSGPHLPLDLGFAIGNFVRDALRGRPILVAGDGTPRRSYLYAADLAIWLWTILFRGESGRIYNVGSSEDLSIAELANKVVDILRPGSRVSIAGIPVPGAPPARYVPFARRAEEELGLKVRVSLEEGIRRMASWAAALESR